MQTLDIQSNDFHTNRFHHCANYLFELFTNPNSPDNLPLASADVRFISKVTNEDKLVCCIVFKYQAGSTPTKVNANAIHGAIQDHALINKLVLLENQYKPIMDDGSPAILFSLTIEIERLRNKHYAPDHASVKKSNHQAAARRLDMPNNRR
jgi:hypothetical protein